MRLRVVPQYFVGARTRLTRHLMPRKIGGDGGVLPTKPDTAKRSVRSLPPALCLHRTQPHPPMLLQSCGAADQQMSNPYLTLTHVADSPSDIPFKHRPGVDSGAVVSIKQANRIVQIHGFVWPTNAARRRGWSLHCLFCFRICSAHHVCLLRHRKIKVWLDCLVEFSHCPSARVAMHL